MIGRRRVLATLGALALGGVAGCVARRPAGVPVRPHEPWRLDPLVDLAPAAGLTWLVVLRPRELFARAILARAVTSALVDGQFDAWAVQFGGIDVRRADALVIAAYGATTLGLVRTEVDGDAVQQAFARRVVVDGRAEDSGVTRLFGTWGSERAQVAVLGSEAVGLERGPVGPLRAAIYFAEGKLKRSLPALRAEPLGALATRLGDGPVRAFAPGPFEGPWAAAGAGLLAGATAAGASLAPAEGPRGDAVLARWVVTGAWGSHAPAAMDRLAAYFHVLAEDPLGRLLGLNHPLSDPVSRFDEDAIELQVVLDPLALGRGLREATAGTIAEILAP
jgi:hypothetical protein